MKYDKEALTFENQAQRLIDRGLDADLKELIRRLQAVSYYRLSGYLYPFRLKDDDQYLPGTTLTKVWQRYCFDRRLRVLMLDAIERIEVAVRTQLLYQFAHVHGAFGHCNEENLPNLNARNYIDWRESLLVETSRSKETFTKHFSEKYGDTHQNLPIWMVAELMSMGSLLTFYKGVAEPVRSAVASHFFMPAAQLQSWLLALNGARNICAHHSRLWNRILGYAPGLPQANKHPDWHLKNDDGKNLLPNNRSGILMFVALQFLTQISPTSLWKGRVEALFTEYPSIPLPEMGLPQNWKTHPLWRES
jgi:abortive infection bacteriophage resistance protein